MGHKHSYNIDTALQTINALTHTVCDMRNDSYVQWGAKQDLYQLKWLIESALRRCPDFSTEDEWLREQEQKKIIKILKDDI
jgi:hypothetical protein